VASRAIGLVLRFTAGAPTLAGATPAVKLRGWGMLAGVNGQDLTRRVIFLDIDGVLAPITRWDRYGDLEPACVRVLNEITVSGGAEVVVSSTWRYGRTVAELQAMLEAAGFIGRVVDTTPIGEPGADRGDEIAAWLSENAVGGYVIIDDHVNVGELRAQLVLTQPSRGLQPSDAPRAIAMLLGPESR